MIFGTSDAAELAHFYFTKAKAREVAGFAVDSEFKNRSEFQGLPVCDLGSVVKTFPPDQFEAFVAVGYSGLNELRKKKYEWFKNAGYSLATYVSPQAICMTDQIGDNCFVQEGCVIQPRVKIGNNVTIWSGAHIAHHSIIEDHCFIAPRAALSGRVVVKEMSFIGINATVKDHVTIARQSLIGAGALVVEDTPERTLLKSAKAVASPLSTETIKKI